MTKITHGEHGIAYTHADYESAAAAVEKTGGTLSPVWEGSWKGDTSKTRGRVVGKWTVRTEKPSSAGSYETLTEYENGDFVLFSRY